MTEQELLTAIDETAKGIARMREAVEQHPLPAMREACGRRLENMLNEIETLKAELTEISH